MRTTHRPAQAAPPRLRTVRYRWAVAALVLATLGSVEILAATFTLPPGVLAFGSQDIGTTSAPLTVTLTNKAKTPLQFTVATTPDFSAVPGCVNPVPAGGTCAIAVRFSPTAVGSRTGTLTVTDVTKASNKDTVRLSGTGTSSPTVTPASLSFGNVATNTTSPAQTVTLTNHQNTALTGISLSTTNSDYAASGCAAPLVAGASCAIAVTFTPTASAGSAENATLTITHSASNSPQAVALSGTSVVPFTLTPTTVTFAPTFQGQTSTFPITLRNNQSATTSIVLSTAAPFSATGCGAPVAGGATCTITARFSPLGAHEGVVNGVLSVSSTSPAAYTTTAAVSGEARRQVTVAPAALDFGGVTVASTSTPLSVTFTNHLPGAVTFGVPLATFTGAASGDFGLGSTTCGATLASGASCTIGVTFHPTVGGARTATLGINSSAFGSPHPVALAGVGTTPLTVTPGAVAFGSVNVGLASAAQQVTIRNNQSIPATVSSLSFSGDFAQDPVGTTCGASIPAQTTCVVSVIMTPAVAGLRGGALVITSNTSESPNSVALSGSGINGVTASVASLTFAPQAVSTTSGPQQVILTNHQTVPAALGTVVAGDFAASDACGGTIAALSTCAVSITFTPAAVGTRSGSATFNNPGSAPILVALQGEGAGAGQPAAVASVVPGAGTVGTTLIGVVVTGNTHTNFSAASAVDFGAGITVSNLRDVSANSLTVDVAVASGAVPGARTVVVTTALAAGGTETASLVAGFVVSASAALPVASVTPDTGAQGQTLDVAIVGTDTHFQTGVTFATFGDGVLVSTLTIADPTHATANVSISPTTTLGWRTVSLVTGGEIASIVPAGSSGPGFQVVAGPAHLMSVAPSEGAQGAVPFTVTVTGQDTHFLQGASVVSLGGGINVGSVVVIDDTHLTASIAVTGGAAVGSRTVTVTTGGEVAALVDGFTVTPAAPPTFSSITPSSAQQGDSLALVTLVGANTRFTTDDPAPTLTLGSNITVAPLVVVDDTTITTSLAIDALAFTGVRTGTLSSGGTNYQFSFTVQPSAAAITAVSPASGPQGGVVTVNVTGEGTHWQQGATTATFPLQGGCSAPGVNAVTVNSPTQATLLLAIPAGACVGNQPFQLATGGEVVGSSFGVYAQTPSLTLGPATAMIGNSPTVTFVGEFTHFGGSTTAIIDGAGVAIQNFSVTSPGSATATFAIDPGATVGIRTVTLTTALGTGGFEVVTTPFVVAATPATLTSVEPFHAALGAQTILTIRGASTHFGPETAVGLGPDIAVGTPSIVSATELTVSVDVGSGAATGWRSVFVNTGSEQLVIGFRVDGAAAPSIQSVTPSSAVQGQSLDVAITGANTSFNGSSTLILGAGVTVSNFIVTGATTATATVAVSPTAPVGPNAVIVLTDTAADQTEVASGAGFSVGRGPAGILSVTPNVVAQNQVLNVSIVGQATNWLQGGTTADFGSGVTVAQLTIVDATHATAQIVVGSSAALGFHTVTLVTDGEYASLAQGIDVQQGTPALLSSTPNAGAQGTSFAVTALGSFTHWVQGETTAAFGDGIVVTGVTVVDSVSAVIGVLIDPLAAIACHPLTITTDDEQVTLSNQLCVQPGAAVLTSVSPNAAPQGSTLTVQITGQNTHFANGLTLATFGDGIFTSNVFVSSPTTASVDLAVSTLAASGFRTATLTTLGESASLALAFNVGQNTPTLNSAAPFSGQPGQSLSVRLIGQHTHWVQGPTTVTFGEGITVGAITVVGATTLDVGIDIGALATLGGRIVTVTTGGEIVSAQIFSVVPGGAAISLVAPQSGNQGQQVALSITGQNTHWQQGFTQFSVAGAGGDITVNYVVVNNETSATVGLTVSPTAAPGPRSVFMVTGAEALVSAGAFVVTGGVPAVASVSPGSAQAGQAGVNVQIAGVHTTWLTGTTTVDFGPGIAVSNVVVNSDDRITAVLDVDLAAGPGPRTVVVRNVSVAGTQALTGSFQVLSSAPPAPSLQYLSPSQGLRGQTFTVSLSAANTHFDPAPNATEIDFGDPLTAGIQIGSFQVTSPTTARANITIAGNAAFGTRTLSIVTHTGTGDEIVQGAFTVVQATPQLTIVDPSAGMQGATLTVNLVGSYTGFNDDTTFNFGPGVTVVGSQVLGATVAQVTVQVDELAPQGARYITATTGTEVVTGTFTVTPSTAVIIAVAPNTAKQGESVAVAVTGQNTLWDGGTVFSFGSGTSVSTVIVDSQTHATMTVTLDALAPLGAHAATATTGGQVAAMVNAFVVQPGTPLILSSSPAGGAQQANVTLTILGQATAWDASTTVDLGLGVQVLTVNPTSASALTVGALVEPLAALGLRTLTVTTGLQVLTLANAFQVTTGSAAIALLSPTQAGQGETLDVAVTGVNTSFVDGTTQASFGGGITVNSTTVTGQASATVNITIAADATVGQRTVSLVTFGETAAIVNGFTVVQTVPYLQSVSPASAAQGSTLDLTVVGSLTNFTAPTTFDFGPGVLVNGVTAIGSTQATVNVSVSPVAARTTRDVSATTAGVTATGANLFAVTGGLAAISAVNPAFGRQGQVGLEVTISGFLTHFIPGTTVVSLGAGVTVTSVAVDTDTQLRATVTIDPLAPVQANDVVVTTLGEVATLPGGFTVQQPYVGSVAPASAYQEQTLDVVVSGVNTSFVNGVTTALFGAGVVVNSVTVQSPTQATVNLTVLLAAVPGARTVTMTTGTESASGAGVFTVLAKETPVITWPTPAGIVYLTALSGAQLNATVDGVDGTFVYVPPADTVLLAGDHQPLTVTFTPTNTIRYFTATATVYIDVAKAPQSTLTANAPGSAVYQATFQVSTTGGAGTGLVTFAVTPPCTNVLGGDSVTMTSGTGTCSVTATKAADANYLEAVSAAVSVNAEKAPQSALTVTGAPGTAANGATFTIGASQGGGMSSGALTFAVAIGDSCTIAGNVVTMTSNTGSCSITATRAADANYLEITSEAAVVVASGPVPPSIDLLPTSTYLSVPLTGTALSGVVGVRLQANGVSVAAPGQVAVSASSDNTACVATTNGTIAAGAYAGSIGISYGNAALPCSATVTVTAAGYGSDVVTVSVYAYADAPVTSAAAALSYFNPALLPAPNGALATSVAALSYYNPAVLPTPTGTRATSVAAVSYYNPAILASPTGTRATSVAVVSYYNPATLPTPSGTVAASVAAVSYYNPATVPTPNGLVAASVASVSYLNPLPGESPLVPQTLESSVTVSEPVENTITVFSVSIANGPTAARVRPTQVSRSERVQYTLRIDGANLTDATVVTLAGIEPYVIVLPPVASPDGRSLTVDVLLAPDTPLGLAPVIVSGPGWTTPDVPGMRLEIVP